MRAVATLVVLLIATGCATDNKGDAVVPPGAQFGAVATPRDGIGILRGTVLRSITHDRRAFTQGLAYHEGYLYESTGRYGYSALRRIDPQTGKALHEVRLPKSAFGEGLTVHNGHLVQLTWHEETAFIYDLESLALVRQVGYTGEGWGLCYDGKDLYTSSGEAFLIRRDAEFLVPRDTIPINRGGEPVPLINELECVGEYIYANVLGASFVIQIDKVTGRVTAELDAAALIPASIRSGDPEKVLNGIAFDPTAGTFYLTGKLWPVMYEVRIEEELANGSMPS